MTNKKNSTFVHIVLSMLVVMLLLGCSNKKPPIDPTAETAITRIVAYADDGTQPVPTVVDYENAGVTGVNADNWADVNAAVDVLIGTDVDTTVEIQAVVDGVNASNAGLEAVKEDITGNADGIPATYVDSTNPTAAEIQAVIDLANKDLTINSTTPADDATDVDATANLSMTFNKTVEVEVVASKLFKIYKADGTEHTSFDVGVAQVTGDGTDTITVNPNSHLVYGAEHYIQIDAGAFKDNANKTNAGITDTTTWNFTVSATSGPCACPDFDNCDLPADLQ